MVAPELAAEYVDAAACTDGVLALALEFGVEVELVDEAEADEIEVDVDEASAAVTDLPARIPDAVLFDDPGVVALAIVTP